MLSGFAHKLDTPGELTDFGVHLNRAVKQRDRDGYTCTLSQLGENHEAPVHESLHVKTVSEYRSRLLAKMKLKTSAELTHYAIRNQLID